MATNNITIDWLLTKTLEKRLEGWPDIFSSFIHMPFNHTALVTMESYLSSPTKGVFFLKGITGSGKTYLAHRLVSKIPGSCLLFPEILLWRNHSEEFNLFAPEILRRNFETVIVDCAWSGDISERIKIFRQAANEGIKIIIIECNQHFSLSETLATREDVVVEIHPMNTLEWASMTTHFFYQIMGRAPTSLEDAEVCLRVADRITPQRAYGEIKKYRMLEEIRAGRS